ncbi:unnamed protein product, partial [Rotaria socialis]
ATTTTTTTTAVYHRLTSADKISTMVKRDLIHDDVHLHDREVEDLDENIQSYADATMYADVVEYR